MSEERKARFDETARPVGTCGDPDCLSGTCRADAERANEYDAPGTGPFYAYDAPTIDRAELHGCLDEDVETGSPIVCATCSSPPDSPSVGEAR